MPLPGLQEERTRVVCQLPCGSAAQQNAVYDVFAWVQKQRDAPVAITGYTHSRLRPPSYEGWWFGREPRETIGPEHWTQDKIVTLIIDYDADVDSRDLANAVKDLHTALRRCYGKHRARQTEFWVTTQQILRYA